jgi:hypothetical protein
MKRFLMASLVVAMFTALLTSSAGGWTNVYGEESPSSYSSAEAVAVDAAGGVIVAGCFSGTFNGELAVDSLDDYVMRLSSSGSVDWISTWDPEPEMSDCKPAAGGMVIDSQGTIFLKQEGDEGEAIRAIAADGSSNEVVATTSGTDIFERSSGFSLFNPDSGHVGFYSSSGDLESDWQPGDVEGSEVLVLGDASGPDGAGGFIVAVSEDPFIELAQSDTHIYRIDGTGAELWATLLRGYELGRSFFGSRYLVHGDELFLENRYMSDPTCPNGGSICARLTVLNLDDGSLVELDREAPSDKLVNWGTSWTEIWNPECVSENADQTVLTFETAGCDPYLGGVLRPGYPDLNYAWFGGVDTSGAGVYQGPTSKRFQALADGTLVGLTPYHADRGSGGHSVGLFQIGSSGGILPMRVSEIIAQPDQSRTYLTDFAVNSATGQAFVVGRVEGSTSVNLRSSGVGRSSLPNALVTSVTIRPAHGFFDVDAGGWRGTAVEWMRSSGVTTGCSATKFCPDQEMTREQQITFLWRYAGEPSPGAPSPFSDVAAGRYFTNPVTWAYNNGITNGVSPTSFGTGQAITRAQAVTFLHRQAGEPAPTVANPFVDVPAGTYYTDPVRWAFENGITTGTSPTTFDPNQAVTRVQFAAFLSRYDNLTD